VLLEGPGAALQPEAVPINEAEAAEDGATGKRSVLPRRLQKSKAELILCQNNRTRESSVVISPSWSMLEEIEFHRLAKLRLEVDEPEEL
jgi:hypothetical protein